MGRKGERRLRERVAECKFSVPQIIIVAFDERCDMERKGRLEPRSH